MKNSGLTLTLGLGDASVSKCGVSKTAPLPPLDFAFYDAERDFHAIKIIFSGY